MKTKAYKTYYVRVPVAMTQSYTIQAKNKFEAVKGVLQGKAHFLNNYEGYGIRSIYTGEQDKIQVGTQIKNKGVVYTDLKEKKTRA